MAGSRESIGPWRDRVTHAVASEPLFVSEATEAGLRLETAPRPRAVYMGIGLCTRHRMAAGLPVDVLGMLLPAERIRAAVGAEHLVVLLADAHAESNGFGADDVAQRTHRVAQALLRVRRAKELEHLRLIRASSLHRESGFQRTLDSIRVRAGAEGNEYMYRQTADVAFLDEALGGILKLGWTVDIDGTAGGYRDEVAFDRLVEPWSGRRPLFAYVRCGRALDDRRPKVSPYVGVDLGRRIYLSPTENVEAKLGRARQLASKRNVAAVREHLGRVADAWGAEGPNLDVRLETVLSDLYLGRSRLHRVAPLRLDSGGSRPAGRAVGELSHSL